MPIDSIVISHNSELPGHFKNLLHLCTDFLLWYILVFPRFEGDKNHKSLSYNHNYQQYIHQLMLGIRVVFVRFDKLTNPFCHCNSSLLHDTFRLPSSLKINKFDKFEFQNLLRNSRTWENMIVLSSQLI